MRQKFSSASAALAQVEHSIMRRISTRPARQNQAGFGSAGFSLWVLGGYTSLYIARRNS
jgi:hypothetical protein